MLTKEQRMIIELKYERIMDKLESQISQVILSHGKVPLKTESLNMLRNSFYGYLKSITENCNDKSNR